MFRGGDEEDGESDLGAIKDRLTNDSPRGRSVEGSCDNCGSSEGSVTVIRNWPGDADEVALCRDCKNNPSVWPDG